MEQLLFLTAPLDSCFINDSKQPLRPIHNDSSIEQFLWPWVLEKIEMIKWSPQ